MNIDEINRTITELENGETTFANCQKLASLYIVRDKLNCDLTKEYKDILPSYAQYKELRIKCAKNEISSDCVEHALSLLCKELQEFIQALYQGTNCASQRETITNILRQIV